MTYEMLGMQFGFWMVSVQPVRGSQPKFRGHGRTRTLKLLAALAHQREF